MRTLKRSICLVLSLVMLLGVCTVFVPADDAKSNLDRYSDKNDIKPEFQEAVDVLTGIGVLVGDSAGFRPKDTINRAEAAKIIAYLLIGNADAADHLKATVNPFSDVDKDWWPAGYIAYCAERGIIDGRGNGKYDPLANVTGIEFVKMLLCAIGYGVNGEYTGAAWAINVAKDGVQYGLFDGNLAGASEEPAKREECAQYAFNTLLKQKVTYSALLGGYIENIATNAESNKDGTIAGDYNLRNTKIINRNSYWTGKQQDIIDNASDAFYRPTGYYWYQNYTDRPVSGSYAKQYLLESYTTPVHANEIYNLLVNKFGESVPNRLVDTDANGDGIIEGGSNDIAFHVYENGLSYKANVTVTPESQLTSDKTALRSGYSFIQVMDGGKRTIRRDNTNILAHTGNGVKTEVYGIVTEDNELVEVRIVLVHTYLARISEVKKATTTTDAAVKVEYPTEKMGLVTYQNGKFDEKLEFKTSDYKEGDLVLVDYSFRRGKFDLGIQHMEYAKSLNNRITRYRNERSEIDVGSTTYYIALDDAVMSTQTRGTTITQQFVNTTNFDVYLDANNYVIGVEGYFAPKNFVYVAQFGYNLVNNDTLRSRFVITAEVYDGNGTKSQRILNTNYSGTYKPDPNVDVTAPKASSNVSFLATKAGWMTAQDLADNWNSKEMNGEERAFIDGLNDPNSANYAVGLYQMRVNSDGTVTLDCVEHYATTQAKAQRETGKNSGIWVDGVKDNVSGHYYPVAVGENIATEKTKIIKNDMYLRTNLKTKDEGVGDLNTNYVGSIKYNLQADNTTLYFYVSGDYPDITVTPYLGFTKAPDTNSSKDSRSLVSWYGEIDAKLKKDGSFDKFEEYAVAEVCLVSGNAPDAEKTVNDAGFVYVDKSESGMQPGSYEMLSPENPKNTTGKYQVIFYAYKGTDGETIAELPFTFDDEDSAKAAISEAAPLVDSIVTVDGDKGLKALATPNTVVTSKDDGVTYIGKTVIKEMNDSVVTLGIQYVGSDNIVRNRTILVESGVDIHDMRLGVSEANKISSRTQLKKAVEDDAEVGTDYHSFRVMGAYKADGTPVALYIVNLDNRVEVKIAGDFSDDAYVRVTGDGWYDEGDVVTIRVQNITEKEDVDVTVSAPNVDVDPADPTEVKAGASKSFTFELPDAVSSMNVSVVRVP